MKIVAVATVKGGVGKTVLSAHLAAGLANAGHRTLLMDLDPQGHATLLCGIEPHPNACCVGDVLLRESRILLSDIVVDGSRSGLQVAPATLKMATQERQLYAWALRLKTVLRALHSLDDEPEVVVIDCPPHIGGYTEAALHAADLTLAPIPALAGSLEGFNDLKTTWEEMRDGRSGEIAGVLTMWDARTTVTNATVIEALQHLDVQRMTTRIPKAEVVNQAALRHQLVFDHAPNHPVALAFEQLAAEVWQKLQQDSERPRYDSMAIPRQVEVAAHWRPSPTPHVMPLVPPYEEEAWPIGADAYMPTGTYSIRRL